MGDGQSALNFRDNAGGDYLNSVITEYNSDGGGVAVLVEDIEGEDSRNRLEQGDLALRNNLWWQFGEGNTLETIVPQDFVRDHWVANNNQVIDPMLRGISRTTDGGLDPRPAKGGNAASGALSVPDPDFDDVAYYGAFSVDGIPWTHGWTALSTLGYMTSPTLEEILPSWPITDIPGLITLL